MLNEKGNTETPYQTIFLSMKSVLMPYIYCVNGHFCTRRVYETHIIPGLYQTWPPNPHTF